MAAIFEQSPLVTLHPKPGFVVKTKIIEGSGEHFYQTKVFINVCHDVQVPKPEGTFEPSVIFPLIVKNEWEIPIIVSPEKKSTDKKGVPSFVYDCCVNSECFLWLNISADLRMIAIEWCIESVEMMHELVLDREYTLPKMLSKGELSATEITQHDLQNSLGKKLEESQNNEMAGLVQELFPDEEEDLPDLMNLAGKKPLIQEIKDLSLEPKPEKGPDERVSKIEEVKSEHMHEISTKIHKLIADQKINYEFTVTQKTRGTDLVVIFESTQLTPQIQVFFHDGRLVVRNNDPTRKLGLENEAEFALLPSHTPYKCFLVMKEMRIYVFMRKD